MTGSEMIQLSASLVGSLCFGVLFNMRGKKLAAATLGGLLSWGLYLLLGGVVTSDAINYFVVSVVVSVYAEVMARRLKTPATPIVTVSLVPLIPGGSLYYTMAYAFESDFSHFFERAVSTFKLAAALALGVIVVTTLVQFFLKKRVRRS